MQRQHISTEALEHDPQARGLAPLWNPATEI